MRALLLSRVRAALGDVPVTEAPADIPVPRDYRRCGAYTPDDLVGLFAERAADYRALVVHGTPDNAPGLIAGLLADQGVTALVVPRGFPDALLAELDRISLLLEEDRLLPPEVLDTAHGVISTCALAIAETGTLVLDAGAGQGRRSLTLLPDYHLCLVSADRIVPDVPDALARLDPRRPLTMVSGPSATSDIENTRIEGVHGPRTLHILVIEPEDGTEWP